jgi:tetratricopeptide (TPR) repeat protein
VLRTAQTLAAANVPQRRITRSIRELRKHLPDSMPLSGLSISAVGDRVAVKEGRSRWQADSGQYLLEFEGDPTSGALSVVEREPEDAQGWFARAVAIEDDDPGKAMECYEKVIAIDAENVDARLNLGRLLHEAKRLRDAEHVYRAGLRIDSDDALLHFNYAVLLDDMERKVEAVQAYQTALGLDASLADAHYNLALLFKRLRRPKDAIRHMGEYRRLTKG